VRKLTRLGIITLSLALAESGAGADARVTTFVQLTDLHLFDTENEEARIANQTAVNWAVFRINEMVMSGKAIDFVVLTGGLGVSEEKLDEAVAVLRPALQVLLVEKIFWLPGAHAGSSAAEAVAVDFKQLKEALGDERFVDLIAEPKEVGGLRFVGLDSTSFGSAKSDLDWVEKIENIENLILPGKRHVVFTHTTDLDGGREPVTGTVASFWKSPNLRRRWTDLALKPDIVAVFAGGVHSQERAPYQQNFGSLGADRLPKLLAKTWVCPPLGSRDERTLETPSRGFLTVTVSHSGRVSAYSSWLTPAAAKTEDEAATEFKDKEGKLLAGQLALEDWRLGEAATAFQEALDSTDAAVRRGAEAGLEQAWARMSEPRWLVDGVPLLRFLARHWKPLGLGALLALLYLIVRYHRRRLALIAPQELTDKAPADLWLAELAVAIDHARAVLQQEERNWYSGTQSAFSRPSLAAKEIAGALPKLKGIDTSKVYQLVMTLERYLGWRLDSEVAGTEQEATLYVSLKWAWQIRATWRIPAVGEQPLDVTTAARHVAMDVLWRLG
jgi:hypothetical protein